MRRLLLWVAIILSGQVLVAQSNRLGPLDVARIQQISGATISDDGKFIAFTRTVPADPLKENKPATNTLHLYRVASGETVPFLTRQSVRGVAFRPGHQSLTFLTRMEEDRTTSLYEMPLAGGEAQQLFSFSTSISSYEWSPDGKKLAFIAAEAGEKEASELPYQPIVYEGNLTFSKAWITDLSDEAPTALKVEGHASRVIWSPQGDRLVCVAAPSPLVDDRYMAQTIYIVSAADREVKGQVEHVGKKGEIVWSPDGAQLALIAAGDVHDPIDGRLLVVDARGGAPVNLAPDFQGQFHHVAWENAKTLVFLASEGVHSVLGSVDATGVNMRKWLEGTEVNFGGMALADGGTAVLTGNTPSYPNEAFIWNKGSDRLPKRITNSNPWLEEKELADQTVVTYEARDGLELEGILIYPLEYEEGQTYPLITVVHGGPESHYNNGWITGYSSPGQMAAAQGYAVFYPNYRGSTGRGEAFAKSSQGDLAGKEFDDIVDGVDHLVEMGLVEEDKVGVTGGSYGGYATGWLATRYTERFAAGVMFVGISDNISKWGTSDIPEELYLVHARKRIWEDYEFFLKRSPIYYADQAKTPLLIMAGAEDTRVDPSQSMELYRHIKTRTDTPVSLILYPGEGHGNRNATARLDYSQRMLGWFDQHLKKQTARP